MKLIFATGNAGKLREAREILGPGYNVLCPSDFGIDGDVAETGLTFQENSLIKAKHLFDAFAHATPSEPSSIGCASAPLADSFDAGSFADGTIPSSIGSASVPSDGCRAIACFADDSGLEVDALGGAPGIYSARYASDHNFADNISRIFFELNKLFPPSSASTPAESASSVAHSQASAPPATPTDAVLATAPAASLTTSSAIPAPRFSEADFYPGAARFRCVVTLLLPDGTPLYFSGSVEGRIIRSRHGDCGFGYDPIFVPNAFPHKTMAELTEDQKNSISHRGVALRAMSTWLQTH